MLIVVKPGIVLTSLTKSSPVCRASRKSTRAIPAPSMARNAAIDSRRISSAIGGVEIGGDHDLRSVVEVLRFVVVELARRDDFAGTDASGSSLPSTAHSISRASGTAASTTILRSKRAGEIDRLGQSPRVVLRLRDADARSEVRRLDEQRVSERRLEHLARRLARPASHSWRRTTRYGQTGRPRAANTTFITALSMPDRRSEHAAADVGDVGELEQALDRAVFAVRAVQDRKDRRRGRGR